MPVIVIPQSFCMLKLQRGSSATRYLIVLLIVLVLMFAAYLLFLRDEASSLSPIVQSWTQPNSNQDDTSGPGAVDDAPLSPEQLMTLTRKVPAYTDDREAVVVAPGTPAEGAMATPIISKPSSMVAGSGARLDQNTVTGTIVRAGGQNPAAVQTGEGQQPLIAGGEARSTVREAGVQPNLSVPAASRSTPIAVPKSPPRLSPDEEVIERLSRKGGATIEASAKAEGSLTNSMDQQQSTLRPSSAKAATTENVAAIIDQPVPALDNSDPQVKEAVAGLDGTLLLSNWLVDEELLRKFVVMIDNMADGSIPRKHSVLRPLSTDFRALEKEGRIYLDGYNYGRYGPYVDLLAAFDNPILIDLYLHYYPLLQQAYAELGFPRKSFHRRLLTALEHILSAPIVEGPIELVQPSVMYKYAAEELEQLSDVHKQLLRMGPQNSQIIIARLTTLKRALLQLQHG